MRHMLEIGQWADEVFPDRTVSDTVKKLSMEEIPELWRSMRDSGKSGFAGKVDGHELADVLILTLDLCYLSGYSPDKIIAEKMAINRKRSWVTIEGVRCHVKD